MDTLKGNLKVSNGLLLKFACEVRLENFLELQNRPSTEALAATWTTLTSRLTPAAVEGRGRVGGGGGRVTGATRGSGPR